MDLQRFGHAPPIACGTATPIWDVAVLMDTHNVGSVVVLDDDGQLAGIVTDRDLVIRAMAHGRDPNTAVSKVMTSDVLSLRADTPLFAAATEMATAGCRRMPVVDEQSRVTVRRERPDAAEHGWTIGVVSERDVTHAVARNMNVDTTQAVDVMTAEIAHADPSDTVLRVAARMMANEVRHLPVIDGEELVGVISERDVLRVLVQALREPSEV
jgi:signal-transduction protein with cAMP-binding, CBS, and nucleotidyltransferase domain